MTHDPCCSTPDNGEVGVQHHQVGGSPRDETGEGQPQRPGRIDRRLAHRKHQRLVPRKSAVGDGEPEYAVHGRGAAGDGVRSRHPGHAVDDIHPQRPEPICPVSHTGRGHRIGNQRHPIGSRAPSDVSIQGGIDVHTVGNQFDGHPGVVQERDHWAGVASGGSGGIALNRCVPTVAPAAIAACVCS